MADREQIQRAADLIRAGRLVAFPTETVYGLGANALDASAVERIFAAKRRPRTSPLIVHVASVEMARQVAAEWPEMASRLAAEFWPGPLTLVLRKQIYIPSIVTAGLPTVGVRMPRHPVALALIEAAGVPIAAPSANRFTELSPTAEEHVVAALGDDVDLVLGGEVPEVGIESTVVSLAGTPALLRPGMISHEQLQQVIGPLAIAGAAGHGIAHPSPGLHDRHYSPRTRLVVADEAPTGNVIWLWWRNRGTSKRTLQMPADAQAYGAVLYRTLHELDQGEWDVIAIEQLPETPEWEGIRDRLSRAVSK